MYVRHAAAFLAVILGTTARAEIDPKTFDPAVKPQDDFFRYANGGWLKAAVIPGDFARWGSFEELRERNWTNVREICERVSAPSTGATAAERLVGDFYASGLDQKTIDAAGLAPLQPYLDRIAAITSPAGVLATIAHLRQFGVSAGFSFGAAPDAKDSAVNIAHLRQGGLTLPGSGVRDSDRDYYLKDDEKSKELREHYVAHIAKMFELAGAAATAATADARAVLELETALAKVSLSRVLLRNPQNNYNKVSTAELDTLVPGVDWQAFFAAADAPKFSALNLAHPNFFKGFAVQLRETPVRTWQAYLRWKLLHEAAPYLSTPFEQENFRFYSGVLTGVTEMKPRWRTVAATVDDKIGDALGQLYVAQYFPPEAKARVLKLVEDLRAALATRIAAAEWMDAPTKHQAQAKLAAFSVKMGYPEVWKDYGALQIDRGPYVLNVFRANAYGARRNLEKIGRPVDKDEWTMTPPTVNARYSAALNDILFPAGILQPPFFDPKADDAVNYGGIGAVIGHEMSHGFDDSGRQYDAEGNLVDWWSPESAANYKARAAAIVKQFSGYTVLDGLPLKGELTQGENIADLGGLKIAFGALQKALAASPATQRAKIDDFTPEQRFFLSWARIWREASRDADQRRRINVDPHSPGVWRVNGPLSNLEEFARAFAVPEGAPMRRAGGERVTIW